jgi:FdhD protein
MMKTHGPHTSLAHRAGRWTSGARALPEEVPVALVFNGTTQAVMMATPSALVDFALGFALSEGIVLDLQEIRETEIIDQDQGIEVRVWLKEVAESRFLARRRAQVGPVGCGLCGIDSLAEASRPLPAVTACLHLGARDVAEAMRGLVRHQTLNDATRAAHAAGFYIPGEGVVLAREDVGRHNALDKLAGALARAGRTAGTGAIVMTSRLSVDLVQKCAVIGAPVLMAASVPTALAVREAEKAGITLVGIVRGEEFEVFTHPLRFTGKDARDVA